MKDEIKVGLFFISPAIILVSFIYFYPLLKSLYISFHRWILPLVAKKGPTFVGLDNYLRLVTSYNFQHSLLVTFYYVGLSVALSLSLGLGMALIVNESFKGRGILRGLFLIPFMMSPVASAVMWKWLLDYSAGAINSIFIQLGLDLIPWLTDPLLALNSAVIVTAWYWTPWVMVIMLGGLQSIPEELYKAAKVDGANAWQRFWYVTLPCLRPFIGVAVLFELAVQMRLPDVIYVLTAGGPGGFTKVLAYLTYEQSFKFMSFGVGSAIGYFIMMISVAAIVVLYFLLKPGMLKYVR